MILDLEYKCSALPGMLHYVTHFVIFPEFEGLRSIRTHTPASTQAQAVKDLISRLLPADKAKAFQITIDSSIGPADRDAFKVWADLSAEEWVVCKLTILLSIDYSFWHKLNVHISTHTKEKPSMIN